jgi:hypothetical protein
MKFDDSRVNVSGVRDRRGRGPSRGGIVGGGGGLGLVRILVLLLVNVLGGGGTGSGGFRRT